MAHRLLGSEYLPVPYQPYTQLERVHPLLLRELSLDQQELASLTLSTFDTLVFVASVFLYGGAFLAFLVVGFRTESLLPVLIVPIPGFLTSLGGDIYASVRIILRWQNASQQEAWDSLRMTTRDDEELLSIYEIVGKVRSWSAFRADMTMRIVPTIGIALGGILLAYGLLKSNGGGINIAIFQLIAVIIIVLSIVWTIVLYTSDSVWRFRAILMSGLLCAIRYREITTAISAAIANVVAIHLVHIGAVASLIWLSFTVLAGQYALDPLPRFALISGWFFMLMLVPTPITQWCYTRLYRWFMQRALYALRSGDV